MGLAVVRTGCLVTVVLLALAGVAAGAQEESAAAAVAFSDGVRAFQAGRDADALQRFGDAVKLDPANGTARYWLGLTLLRLGRPGEAVEQIERSLRPGAPLEVDSLWVRHDLGAAQLAAGDAPAAARTLGAVVDELGARLKLRRNDVDRLQGLAERAKARLATAKKAGAGEKLTDELEEEALEANAAVEARQLDERLLARSLRREADALVASAAQPTPRRPGRAPKPCRPRKPKPPLPPSSRRPGTAPFLRLAWCPVGRRASARRLSPTPIRACSPRGSASPPPPPPPSVRGGDDRPPGRPAAAVPPRRAP